MFYLEIQAFFENFAKKALENLNDMRYNVRK
jgi:hypothetical protein